MTDPNPAPVQIIEDLDAAPSHDSVAELPEHHDHAIVNRRLDEDAV
jgi:hypothetical protein